MKNKILALVGLSVPLATFAEGSTPTMDTTSAETIVSSATTGLQSLLTAVTPYVTTLILAGLAIWAGMVIIRVVKRAFSRAG